LKKVPHKAEDRIKEPENSGQRGDSRVFLDLSGTLYGEKKGKSQIIRRKRGLQIFVWRGRLKKSE